MNKPFAVNKLAVGIFGICNSGKSSLLNALTKTKTAIVSELPGTTTDPVIKSMELLPHGPITIIDTAGTSDNSPLGEERITKTRSVLNRVDFAIYVVNPQNTDIDDFNIFKTELAMRKTPFVVVVAKSDLTHNNVDLEPFKPHLQTSIYDDSSIDKLRNHISNKLDDIQQDKPNLLQGILKTGSVVVLVIPIDAEAPVGRLILPQVQLIRECLDNNIRCNITTLEALPDVFKESKRIDLVITDSQIFQQVNNITPKNISLTSFSILLARQKGDINKFIDGCKAIESLETNSKILIAETCTHSTGHDDIGTKKIPAVLNKFTGKSLDFTFVSGRDFPENLHEFSLIVHCGGCMISQKEMTNRILMVSNHNISIVNYGILLAYCNGILDRCIDIL